MITSTPLDFVLGAAKGNVDDGDRDDEKQPTQQSQQQQQQDDNASSLSQRQPLPLLDPLHVDDENDDEHCATSPTQIPFQRWLSSPLSFSANTEEHSSSGGERISALDSGGDGSIRSSGGTNSQQSQLFPLLHSDFTIPTSNRRRTPPEDPQRRTNNDPTAMYSFHKNEPPTDVLLQNGQNVNERPQRRSIFPTYHAQRGPNCYHGGSTSNNVTATAHHPQSQSFPTLHTLYNYYDICTEKRKHCSTVATAATTTTTATTTSRLWNKPLPIQDNDTNNDDGEHHIYYANHPHHCDPAIPFYALQRNGILARHPQPSSTTQNTITTITATTTPQHLTNVNNDSHPSPQCHNDIKMETSSLLLSSSSKLPFTSKPIPPPSPKIIPPPPPPQKQQTNNSPQRSSQIIFKESSAGIHVSSAAEAAVDVSLVPSRHPPKHSHPSSHHHHHKNHVHRHETRHAQSLLLGCAFAGLWSSSNLTAPNLTEMAAAFFDHNDHTAGDRDWYMGSLLALVVSVGSLPTAAVLGILADVVPSRKHLFCTVLWGGTLSCGLTAYCTTYTQLVVCRWFNGGCLAGSVPVAFSLLADWFDVSERNVASSGLTALMGLGIIAGQVYAGGGLFVADKPPWSQAFVVTAVVQALLTVLCMYVIRDPVRGGREKVLQDLLQEGRTYERKLTVRSLIQAVCHNSPSNTLLLWQGLFSSIPWGVTFVFLNDFLSQERGFSVPDATYLVAIFGVGCAAGGVLGGYVGQVLQESSDRRSLLPLFMAVTTGAGILPFLGLLNSNFPNAHSIPGVLCATLGGLVASLPAVNVRPCLLNVNFPESRGVSLTTANLLIQLGRGIGPTCLTLIQSTLHVNRTYAFNVTLIVFWTISAFQLLLLMKTLPRDQDAMEAELALYAAHAISAVTTTALAPKNDGHDVDDETSIVTIEERMTSFDDIAAKETLVYVRAGIQELRSPLFHCTATAESSCESDDDDDEAPVQDTGSSAVVEETTTRAQLGRDLWPCRPDEDALDGSQHFNKWTDETLLLPEPRTAEHLPTETTPLIV